MFGLELWEVWAIYIAVIGISWALWGAAFESTDGYGRTNTRKTNGRKVIMRICILISFPFTALYFLWKFIVKTLRDTGFIDWWNREEGS